jgi:hypothetical protein
MKYVSKSGSDILCNGNPMNLFEWSHLTINNKFAGMARHLSAKQSYDQEKIPKFEKMVNRWLKDFETDKFTDFMNDYEPSDLLKIIA